MEEVPNPNAQKFYDMLSAVDKNYGMLVLNIPNRQQLHDCCIRSRALFFIKMFR